ncbi:hypothetical protein FACS189468_3820 [Spirochaetia bacterium]|nr:hypothetical protein FACS189468_3820 [Spirochaetia bacterium]
MEYQDRKLFIGDEATNFREIKAGNIVRGILYRSSHPLVGGDIGNAIGRFAKKAGIKCVLNLDDGDATIEAKAKDAPWYKKLITEKRVIGLNMDMNIPGAYFNEKLKKGLRFMISHDGPYLIHCFAGVDRTGFVSAVLEGLMGATLKEICNDYFASFSSGFTSAYDSDDVNETVYYGGNIDDVYHKTQILYQLGKMNNGIAVTDGSIQSAVERYLLDDAGLSAEEIAKLKNILANSL